MNESVTEKTDFLHLVKKVLMLSIPAILAEMTSTVMQYIDAAMVGSLGKEATAAIGLVSTSTWLIGGICISAAIGFSVQVAQLIGAGKNEDARSVFSQSLTVVMLFSILLMGAAISISGFLPKWLGGEESIRKDASAYFLIFAFGLPFEQLRMLSAQMLQCSGNIKTPSVLNIMLCVLDVIFNFIFIFPTRSISLPFTGSAITVFGMGLGVEGAALGTAATTLIGQSLGAKRRDLARKYAWITIIMGILMMSAAAVVMYFSAPFMFSILTKSQEVRILGVRVLRIEAFAEPLYATAIVCSGVLRGAGDTLVPSIINLVSMWGVRIVLSLVLVSGMGLVGIWLAMCIELCFRGTLTLARTIHGKWLNKVVISENTQ